MEDVIYRIEGGDKAAVEIGIEFIEQDQKFPFGKILKSNTARALRRAELSNDQIERIRKRLVTMLLEGLVPHEYKEYAKLLRKIGMGNWWETVEARIARDNEYVMHYYEYFRKYLSK
jgi:hypothetical protein